MPNAFLGDTKAVFSGNTRQPSSSFLLPLARSAPPPAVPLAHSRRDAGRHRTARAQWPPWIPTEGQLCAYFILEGTQFTSSPLLPCQSPFQSPLHNHCLQFCPPIWLTDPAHSQVSGRADLLGPQTTAPTSSISLGRVCMRNPSPDWPAPETAAIPVLIYGEALPRPPSHGEREEALCSSRPQ